MSAGRPVPSAEVRIVDSEGRELPPGQVGEISARGPKVTKGCWSQPEHDRHRRALDETRVIAHCKTLIAGYKCPRSAEFRRGLPQRPQP